MCDIIQNHFCIRQKFVAINVCELNTNISIFIGEDYNLFARTEINFPPEEERMAFSLQLLDDQLPEETESFQLLLVTEDDQSNISFSLTTTTVNIVDNDGE